MKQIYEDTKVLGMKWDNLVLNFKWTFEFKRILASDKFDEATTKWTKKKAETERAPKLPDR